MFNRIFRDLSGKRLFDKVDANWKGGINTVANQYKNTKHFKIEIIQIHTSLKKNEGYVYQKL